MSAQGIAIQSLGSREPLEILANEFRFNRAFCEKLGELEAMGYTDWRRIRGDGNCFYRSVGYGWLEAILEAPVHQQTAWSRDLLRKLETLHFDSRAEQDAHQRLIAHVGNLAAGRGWQETSGRPQHELLEASFMDNHLDLALVRALRALIGQYLLANADDDIVCNGISFRVLCAAQGQGSPEDFCRTTVLQMGKEAETQILRATVQALGVRLHIVLLDRAEDARLCFENYDVIGGEGVEHPLVHVQIRPGHYDLIYRRPEPQDPVRWRHRGHEEEEEKEERVVDECQRYFCRECATPFLWRQGDKPNVRCEKCGRCICVLCLAEASRPRSLVERAKAIAKGLRQSQELLCPHVTAQLELNDDEKSGLKAQLQQENADWAGAVDVLEEQFQEQFKATERAEAGTEEALARVRAFEQRRQNLEKANEELKRESEQLERRRHDLDCQIQVGAEERQELSERQQQLEGRCQVLEQSVSDMSSQGCTLEQRRRKLEQDLQQVQAEASKNTSRLEELHSQAQQLNSTPYKIRLLFVLWVVLLLAFVSSMSPPTMATP